MKKRSYTIPAGPFLSPDVFPQCVGIFGGFKLINILTYVSKRRSEASVSFFLKSLEMDHFRCSVAPQIPMFSLYCIFSISIGALHVIGYKNIHAFGCAATAATNPRVTIRIDGKSDAGAQTRTRRAARARAASLRLRPSRKLSRASSASRAWPSIFHLCACFPQNLAGSTLLVLADCYSSDPGSLPSSR